MSRIFFQIRIRQVKYLNNIHEQDHRGVKRITKPMLGFRAFHTAESTIVGIELHRMLRKERAAKDPGHFKNCFTILANWSHSKINNKRVAHKMKIYTIKIALHGVSPMIWRRLRIPGDTSLAQLYEIIQIAFNWDNDPLHQFHIYGKDYGINYIGAVRFSDNAYELMIDDFEFDVGDKFRYNYNFFSDNRVDIRIEKIIDSRKQLSVFCLKGNGLS